MHLVNFTLLEFETRMPLELQYAEIFRKVAGVSIP